MTTIAYDGITLAADSLVTSGSTAFGKTNKIYRLRDKGYVALAGNIAYHPEIVDWLNGAPMPEVKEGVVFSGLHISPEGVAEEFGESLKKCPACVPWAGGSGEAFALAGLALGLNAVEAVKLACKLDIYSRGPVRSVKIK